MSQNVIVSTTNGTKAHPVPVSGQYDTYQISILTTTGTGVVTVRAKPTTSTRFTDMINGTTDLETCNTLLFTGNQMTAFEFSIDPRQPYTVKIKMTGADTER